MLDRIKADKTKFQGPKLAVQIAKTKAQSKLGFRVVAPATARAKAAAPPKDKTSGLHLGGLADHVEDIDDIATVEVLLSKKHGMNPVDYLSR